MPPLGSLQTGMQRFDTLTTGGIARVTFLLDGKPVLTKRTPPFSVELDLGSVPRTRLLAVTAFDEADNPLASDEIRINAPAGRFRVRLAEPRKGKRYESSLLAQAEVEAPEREAIERVELFLNEARVATLYQPPYVHPVILPRDASSNAYVRAVAYHTDGGSHAKRGLRQRPRLYGGGQRRPRRAVHHRARPPGPAGDRGPGTPGLRRGLGRRPASRSSASSG